MMSSLRPADMEDVLRRIPFMVSFATEIDETAEFADIVLPDTHDLERDDVFPANHPFAFVAPGPTPWYWTRRRAAVAPRGEARHWMEVMIDLLHRRGLSDAFYRAANELLDLPPEHALDPGGRYRIAEMAERQVASFGPRARADRPAFEGGSTWVTGERTAAEMYPGPFLTARIPVYNEYFLGKGRAVRAWAERLGIDWETVDYQPLPDFRPVADDEQPDPRYDLYAVTYKLGFMALGRGPLNPWLSELAESHPYAYRIWLSRAAAEARGIAEGDWVAVESRSGRVEGIAHVSEGIHPEAVGIAGIHGHWARQAGAAAGNGVHFNALLGMRTGIVDKLSSAFDAKPRVRVERLAGGERRA
jgi:anaerobic selenocysteine-containing dehydrogenase